MARSTRLLCGVLVAVATGCGGGVHRAATLTTTAGTSTATASPTTTAKPSSTTASTPPSTTTTTAATTTTTTTTLPTPTADAGPQYFQLPSGNIGCYLEATDVRCDIRDRQWTPPPRPGDCELDWGQGIELSARGAVFACAGDTSLGGPDTLAYGQAARRGMFVCNSTTAGISCRDLATGHGFSLAREGYKIT